MYRFVSTLSAALSPALPSLSRSAGMTALVLLALAQSGCSIFQPVINLFSDDEARIPAELQPVDEEVGLQRQWSVRVGNGQGDHYTLLKPAISGNTVYAAGANGVVVAIDRESGEQRWRNETRQPITGAVGAGNGLVLFGTREAEVFALNQESGEILWSAPVSSEVLAAPSTNGSIVAVQTVDGKLLALEADSGARRWIYESTVPALTLRGSSRPLIYRNMVIAGFSNGTLVAVNANNGFLQWEERVAIPQGRYDIQRIIDVDGDLLVSGATVLAAAYQGNLMAFDVDSGRIVWGMEASSYHGLAQGFGNIYYSNDVSHLVAMQSGSDDIAWRSEALEYRAITAPETTGNYVVVGDMEGYVHVFSQIDGRIVGRTRVDRRGIRAGIIADRSVLYVYGNSGRLTALELR